MVMNEFYRVKIKTNDFEVEVESSSKEFVLEEIKKAHANTTSFRENLVKHNKDTPPPMHANPKSEEKKLSLGELYRVVQPKGAPEAVTLVTYYKEKFEGQPEVTSKDIIDSFRSIKFKCTNTTVAISRAKSNGYLMDGSSSKTFVVTNTAEKMIEEKTNTMGAQ
jgi:hypothetical protein